MKMKMSACIEAPKEKVWQILSDVSNVDLWVDPIISAHCETDKKRGVGMIRVCQLKGNMTVREKWVKWDEGNSYTYQAFGAPLIKSARNTWSIESVNGKTLLVTESEVVLKAGIFGRLLEPLIYLVTKKMGADSLAAFKYLVEVGRPYEGKFSGLPRVPVVC
ncbi:MAG: SRPBCC family protein [Gammaproteobacteria bacterium]|nr:SRPBCC family protein [Gammaproteobacteria bacterium]